MGSHFWKLYHHFVHLYSHKLHCALTISQIHRGFMVCCYILVDVFTNKNQTTPNYKVDFDYTKGSGRGPEDWGKLHLEWAACGQGRIQSPIDLGAQSPFIPERSVPLNSDYIQAQAFLANRGFQISLRWEGLAASSAGGITIDNVAYALKGCHWHSPSEHTFHGYRYPLELHMVHQSSNGKFAVVSVTYKMGRPDALLHKLMEDMRSLGSEDKRLGFINPRDVMHNYHNVAYYRYEGSLTTPPCTEGVIWTIIKKVKTVSWQQLITLRGAVDCGYQSNARPTQPTNGRPVWFFT
ncbi:alpha carbonic anhydrase 4 isoform X1 [Amborella trichopoda]|uniref:alpha carbonic anhydrase 4 isoform X1 n=1 Tax=Amborella trichopoda TaxID=13333 RepID=UPI0009BDEDFF|nr:alpha carbonic anhydrase 4 isoform X1 [Amborella trichopoda]XP_020522248.1 alpha carbonic anhydrase 4 isoform X1 [Amborella trichopoda]XP_020522249.1 alpha carbonic anhydrase 4 isoform X1 [Amborella trichopoda]XP_020522250.1 alpha carbonic anhydrase 4 isoform X1 [Amborella trichopoda]XP_020522251.1 alpha carbonic anhydrase 4 isoform X1 [Amborella trichopoda]|eukprot:XP_020522247.1 alpha carbonic anhydrase 4 isoform X1 [Amborella trichopoda]